MGGGTPTVRRPFGLALRVLSIALLGMGGIGWLFGVATTERYWGDSPYDIPLGGVCGALWRPQTGTTYIASCYSGRVQSYNSAGEFIGGWGLPSGGGLIALRADETGPVVDVVRTRKAHRFGCEGADLVENGRGDCGALVPVVARGWPLAALWAQDAGVARRVFTLRVTDVLLSPSSITIIGGVLGGFGLLWARRLVKSEAQS
jgi:hypothetical protein